MHSKKLKILMILLTLKICLNSCKHKPVPPVWDGHVYRFSMSEPKIFRKINGELIDQIDIPNPELKYWSALTDEDFKKLFLIINECQAWPQDVQYYIKALKSCGILTKKNQQMIKNCLDNQEN